MKRRFNLVLLVTTSMLLSLSCTEEQNFDQIDDLTITPTLASGLFYFESDEQTINDTTSTQTFYTQTIDFQAFNETYVAERLLEGTITYEIENTTSKNLQITIEFLDASGNVLDTEIFDIEADPSGIVTREVAYGPGGKSLDILIATTQLRITANNLSGTTSTSSNTDPKIKLGSGAEFLFQLK